MTYDIQQLFNDSLVKDEVTLGDDVKLSLDVLVLNSEKQKGVITVALTGLIYKFYHPEQDVRYHQSKMVGGYSGRSFDSKYVTPFLKANDFPCMAESGWLTRSLEQALPYDENFSGSISGKGVKEAFLKVYEATNSPDLAVIENMLAYTFRQLVAQRDAKVIRLIKPSNLTLTDLLALLEKHISAKYSSSGGARLPNLAIYALYACVISGNQGRYKGKVLMPLNSHTASDKSTKAIGDVQVNNVADDTPFEGIEIKAQPITPAMLIEVLRKIQEYPSVKRYYVLSTHDINPALGAEIQAVITQIRLKHGCDVVVNGVFSTLKYFLRLANPEDVVSCYTEALAKDEALKYEHKEMWNTLCSS